MPPSGQPDSHAAASPGRRPSSDRQARQEDLVVLREHARRRAEVDHTAKPRLAVETQHVGAMVDPRHPAVAERRVLSANAQGGAIEREVTVRIFSLRLGGESRPTRPAAGAMAATDPDRSRTAARSLTTASGLDIRRDRAPAGRSAPRPGRRARLREGLRPRTGRARHPDRCTRRRAGRVRGGPPRGPGAGRARGRRAPIRRAPAASP